MFYFIPAAGEVLPGIYDPWLVLLSVLVAIFTSTLALQMVELAARGVKWLRLAAVTTGSLALGSGVWAMHFIAMLAFNLCTPVSYDPLITALSMLPSIAASAVALTMIARARINRVDLLIGGVLVGAGIGVMHYLGMAAMHMIPVLRYDPWYFALSIVVAVVLAVAALWMRFRLRRFRRWRIGGLLLSGTVMGLAISGMHYTGMAAARFYGDPAIQTSTDQPGNLVLALGISFTTLVIAVLAAAINGMLRYRSLVAEVRASEMRIRAIMATAVDGIISIRSSGEITHMNQAAETMFGWSAAEMVGRNVADLMPDPHREGHDSYLLRYLRTGEARIIGGAREVMARRRDGTLFPIRLAVGHARLPDEDVFVGFVTDITDRRQLDQSLREAKDKAEQAAAARTAFLANMSHEIRTPMNAILGFAEVLLGTPLNQEQSQALSIVRNSARSLLRLLNEVLDTAKLDRGAMELLHLPFDLESLSEEIVATLAANAAGKGIELKFEFDPHLPTRYLGDELRLRQVLGNLLGNAVKFTEAGSVKLDVFPDQGQVHFRVSDTGIGIPADRLAHIFEPFTQADASLSRRYGGTGLGTTISKQLVELMRGSIWVESEPGVGSVFHVLVPLTPTDREAENAPAVEEMTEKLPPLRILAVDDVPQNLELLRMMLGGLGHNVTLVDRGEQALLQVMAEKFDLILLDIHMPGLNGLETAARLRKHEREAGTQPIPIIALSASVLDSDRFLAAEAGMNGFVPKPVERAHLLQEMARVLGRGGRIAGSPTRAAAGRMTFDRHGALLRWDEDWLTLAGMLDEFFQQYRGVSEQLRMMLRTGGVTEAFDLAHRVKGVASNLGLADLSAWLASFESATTRDRQSLPVLLDEIEASMQRSIDELAAELAQRRPQPRQSGGLNERDPAALAKAFGELLVMVRRGAFDDDSLSVLAAMLPESQIQPIRRALEDFDFAQAETLLRDLAAVEGVVYG